MAANDFLERIADAETRIPTPEHMLGKGLLMPGANLNAGARKIMHGTHRDHVLGLMQGEKAILETGYEIRYGDLSSSVTVSDSNYKVVAKVTKYSFSPNHHYYLILEDEANKKVDIVERVSYHHITETYGYLYNNEYMDNLSIGQIIPKGQIVQKSLGFDEYMNRQDGQNLYVAYMSLDKNMEDSMILSEDAAKLLTSPLIKPVQIMINENDIPLNLYGTDDVYKSIPDIGEDIKNAVLIGLRKEKKEESLFNQSVDMLKKLMMSDDKYTLIGKVIDVNIYCNNPEILDLYYNGQFKMYYEELQRMVGELDATITPFVAKGYKLSYEAEKIFANAKRVRNNTPYINKKPFSNIMIEVTVLEEKELQVGDKSSNRYGGKGVTSTILPPELMPQFEDVKGKHHVQVIMNSNGVYGRENVMQLFELSITHMGIEIINYIIKNNLGPDQAYPMIIQYMDFISHELALSMQELVDSMSPQSKVSYLESIKADGVIHLSAKPISESISIDKLDAMYKAFPFVEQTKITVPIKDSMGNIRYVQSRRPIIVGKQYMFRLKQYAEEKFSATNLSATNIRNENTKSKASREFRELHSNTPIRFGNMESNDLNHMGSGYVVINLLIHSLSPHARRLTEEMFTGDPYHVDIKLDNESFNRSAEIANTYMKVLGRRLLFTKRKIVRKKILITPITSTKPFVKKGIFFNKEKDFNWDKDWEERQALEEKKKNDKNLKHPIIYYGTDTRRREARYKEEHDYEFFKWQQETLRNKAKEMNNLQK